MQKITPWLWFDTNAEEAVNFYTSLFNNSKVHATERFGKAGAAASGMPEGTVMTVDFELEGQKFGAVNGGPLFKFTPAISLFVTCETLEEIDALWAKLAEGGTVMMEFQEYPFSKKYGWLSDKFGLSWQLNWAPDSGVQKIRPCLMFVGDLAGKAEEAMNFYTSLFKNSSIPFVARYEAGEGDTVGTVKHATFILDDYGFIAMDSSGPHHFGFTQAISFMVNCATQEEIDYFTAKFVDGGEQQPCGWVLDKFGVAWQIAPNMLRELMLKGDAAARERVMAALMQMTKIDIAALEQARDQI